MEGDVTREAWQIGKMQNKWEGGDTRMKISNSKTQGKQRQRKTRVFRSLNRTLDTDDMT